MTPLERAIAIVGNQNALARRLNISPQAVNQWVRGLGRITAERALEIEQATDGQVTRYELRPDLFGPASANLEAEEVA